MPIDHEHGLAPTSPVPTEGSLQLRVRYCECDPMGVAHHGSYAAWLEMGRTELLRGAGVSYEALERAGVFLVITKLDLRYRRPIRYDDVVEVQTRVVNGSRVKIRHEYDLVLVERAGAEPKPSKDASVPHDGVCAIAATELACVTGEGRVQPLPDWLVKRD
jgi:acyl-CoA thioester hydrolase